MGQVTVQQYTLAQLAEAIHKNAKDKGWWDEERNVGEALMLVVTELSEAMELYRSEDPTKVWLEDSKPEGFLVELADVVIRVLDLAAGVSSPEEFEKILVDKMRYNKTRPYRHGGKKA